MSHCNISNPPPPNNRKIPPQGSIILDVCKVTGTAIKQRFNGRVIARGKMGSSKVHFLDYAAGFYPDELISDCKGLMEVLYIFLPVPIFWSLFDQQSTRWMFQAARLDLSTPFNYTIAPDQMHVSCKGVEGWRVRGERVRG